MGGGKGSGRGRKRNVRAKQVKPRLVFSDSEAKMEEQLLRHFSRNRSHESFVISRYRVTEAMRNSIMSSYRKAELKCSRSGKQFNGIRVFYFILKNVWEDEVNNKAWLPSPFVDIPVIAPLHANEESAPGDYNAEFGNYLRGRYGEFWNL